MDRGKKAVYNDGAGHGEGVEEAHILSYRDACAMFSSLMSWISHHQSLKICYRQMAGGIPVTMAGVAAVVFGLTVHTRSPMQMSEARLLTTEAPLPALNFHSICPAGGLHGSKLLHI